MKTIKLNATELANFVYYDETSKTCLRWKTKHTKKVIKDAQAGYFSSDGRCNIRINNVLYKSHRVIYMLHNGDISEDLEIDHKDRNTQNNLISNLRLVTHEVNMRNTSKQENNRSGVTGVNYKEIYDKRKDYLYKGWRAEWRDLNGKNCTKLFSIRKYGYQKAFELACAHRDKMIEGLRKAGAGYSITHGQ